MAVYTESPDGTINLLQKDMTVADVVDTIKTAQVEAGLPVSDCVKETLSAKIPEPTNGV